MTKPGDVIVWSSMFPNPLFSGLIKVFTGQATHVSLAVGEDKIIEAMREGVVVNKLSDRLNRSSPFSNAWLLPLDRRINENKLFHFCVRQIGKKYDLWQALQSARDRVEGDDERLFCSELVAYAFRAVGLLENPGAFTPTDIVNLPFYGMTIQLKGRRRLRKT